MPQQHYFWQFLLNLTKVILLRHDFFLDFQCVCCYKVTVLYVYSVVWGVTDWAFPVWGSNCTNSVDLCHFSCFLAQLSPPATIRKNVVRKILHDPPEAAPWIALHYNTPVLVQRVKLFSRIDCCGERTKNVHVR